MASTTSSAHGAYGRALGIRALGLLLWLMGPVAGAWIGGWSLNALVPASAAAEVTGRALGLRATRAGPRWLRRAEVASAVVVTPVVCGWAALYLGVAPERLAALTDPLLGRVAIGVAIAHGVVAAATLSNTGPGWAALGLGAVLWIGLWPPVHVHLFSWAPDLSALLAHLIALCGMIAAAGVARRISPRPPAPPRSAGRCRSRRG